MTRRVVSTLALGALLAALAAPAVAVAQGGPSLGAPETTDTTTPTVTTTGDPSDGGLKAWQEVLIFTAGVVLLGGIAAAIIADARRSAPGRGRGRRGRGEDADARLSSAEAHRHRQQAGKQRARQKGRSARAARRRNR
jgi:hypothetical protein